jgi:ankyrin repeat protein
MGQEETFFYFLSKIKEFDSSTSLLSALDTTESGACKLRSFLEEMYRYQSPCSYTELLGGFYGQDDIEWISRKLSLTGSASSPHAIKQIPLEVVFKQPFILDKKELIDSLFELQKLLDMEPDVPVVIMLSNDIHAFGIKYNAKTKCWTNRDIALLENESYEHYIYTTPELAESIFRSFDDTPDEYTGFTLSLVVSQEHAPRIKALPSPVSIKLPSLKEQLKRKNSREINLLWLSMLDNFIPMFKTILIEEGINPNEVNIRGETLLHLACIRNSLERVTALLAHDKIRPHERDYDGFSPLDRACASGFTDIVNALLHHKDVNPNEWDPFNQTPLHSACASNSLDVVKVLLAHPHIRPNKPNAEGHSPLDLACLFGHVKIVRALLAHPKTYSTVPGADGLLPLDRARISGFKKIEKALLAHKDSISADFGGKLFNKGVPCLFHKGKKTGKEEISDLLAIHTAKFS